MKPTIGPSHVIIAQALELGILCRPVYHNILGGIRVSSGEALEVSEDLFWHVDGAGGRRVFHPSPSELVQDWALTTRDIIVSEWHKAQETPF